MEARYLLEEAFDAGYTDIACWREAGSSAEEAWEAGYTLNQLRDAGYIAKQMTEIGFSHADLFHSGYQNTELVEAGFQQVVLKVECAGSIEVNGFYVSVQNRQSKQCFQKIFAEVPENRQSWASARESVSFDPRPRCLSRASARGSVSFAPGPRSRSRTSVAESICTTCGSIGADEADEAPPSAHSMHLRLNRGGHWWFRDGGDVRPGTPFYVHPKKTEENQGKAPMDGWELSSGGKGPTPKITYLQ